MNRQRVQQRSYNFGKECFTSLNPWCCRNPILVSDHICEGKDHSVPCRGFLSAGPLLFASRVNSASCTRSHVLVLMLLLLLLLLLCCVAHTGLTIKAYNNEDVEISGGLPLTC